MYNVDKRHYTASHYIREERMQGKNLTRCHNKQWMLLTSIHTHLRTQISDAGTGKKYSVIAKNRISWDFIKTEGGRVNILGFGS